MPAHVQKESATQGTKAAKRQRKLTWIWLLLALLSGIPAISVRVWSMATGDHLGPQAGAALFGAGIVAAAFLITWAAEVAEMDVSAALALAVLALVAVLPEYSVDMVFAWKAGMYPHGAMVDGQLLDYKSYAAANMTGGNRLLVGLGWPLVAALFWFKARKSISLHKGVSLELAFLLAATLYAFIIVLRREIAIWDGAVLVGLFGLYIWFSGKQEKQEEPELVGPSAWLGLLPKTWRRVTYISLFIYAALIIFLSAEPFAEGLVETGRGLNIDEFVLVQWVAPLASEAPEIIVAAILTLGARPAMAMMALISSKVNQWTLLVGCLPIVYSISLGSFSGLSLGERQHEEFLLTAAQSLFAVVLLTRMSLGRWGAFALFILFITQLALPIVAVRLIFSYVYIGLAALILAIDRARLPLIRDMFVDVFNMARGKAPA